MFIFMLVAILTFILVHSTLAASLISKWLNRPSAQEKELFSQIVGLKKEQSALNMVDNFAKYSKIQRRINKLEQDIDEKKGEKGHYYTLPYFINIGVKGILSLLLFILSIYYRYTPVFTVNKNIDLTPFNFVVCYPNDINQVSFHFWVLCCTAVAELIKL